MLTFNGSYLKKSRKENNLTLEGLAKLINSSKSYIWEVENNNINIGGDKILQIAWVLECSPYIFYDGLVEVDEDA